MGSIHESKQFKKVEIDIDNLEMALITIKKGGQFVREIVVSLQRTDILPAEESPFKNIWIETADMKTNSSSIMIIDD